MIVGKIKIIWKEVKLKIRNIILCINSFFFKIR